MLATKYDVQRALTRISHALARPADWLVDNIATYCDAIERHRVSVEALEAATKTVADTWTEERFPPVGVLLGACRQWAADHRTSAARISEECPLCVAVVGKLPSGRLATLHEPHCSQYDPMVHPLTERTA